MNQRKVIRIFCFVCFHLIVGQAISQFVEKDFLLYTVNEGLSDNNVFNIIQDSDGFIWVGTEIGLNKFNGFAFENYYQDNPEKFLASSYIQKLTQADSARLLIATRKGFQVLSTKDFSIQHYQISDTTPLVALRNMAWDVAELDDGNYAMTTPTGFYVFHREGHLIFRHDAYSPEDINNKRILYGKNIFTAPDNKLLVYVESSDLMLYDHRRKDFREITLADASWKWFRHPNKEKGGYWKSKSQISDHEYIFLPQSDSLIYYDHIRRKAIASSLPKPWKTDFSWASQVVMLDDTTFVINGAIAGMHIFHINRQSGVITGDSTIYFPGHKVNTVYKDKESRLWIGTSEGLLKQEMKTSFFDMFSWPVEGDASGDIYTDGYLHKGFLYLTRFSRNVGLVKIDTSTWQIVEKYTFYGPDQLWNAIHYMEMYHPDTLWLGTQRQMIWFDTKSGQYGRVADLFKGLNYPKADVLAPVGKDGYAWMCGLLNGRVYRYHRETRSIEFFDEASSIPVPFRKIKSITYDAFGDVWFGGHGLARWNNGRQLFDTLITVYGGPGKYNDDIVVIQADAEGSIWLHNGNGLLKYHIRNRTWSHFGRKEGLPSELIRCFSPVIDHTLWLSGHNELVRFDLKETKFEVYNQSDGVPSERPLENRYMYFDNAGRQLYAFHQDKVLRIPVDFNPTETSVSDLLIQQVVINGERVLYNPQKTFRLRHHENDLSVHYALIDFEDGNNYEFEYTINDEASWNSLGNDHHVNLSNLPPGDYSLQLRSTAKTGDQKHRTLIFSIAPPLWKTFPFILGCIITGVIVLYFLYRWHITHLKQKASLDKLLSQAELKALHAQMNPHFIFNSLNSIRKLVLNNENREASRYLGKFAHLIRMTLDQSGQSFISLRECLDYLQRYIEMEKIRNRHFSCTIDLDGSLDQDEILIPPMLIQPFVENAIWHGLNSDEQQIDISVRFEKQGAQLVCIVDDNGIGINASIQNKSESEQKHKAVGISNIQSRIKLLNEKHKLDSSITMEDKSIRSTNETGTRVTLRLPLEIEE